MNASKTTLKALCVVLFLLAFQTLAQADPQVYVASTGSDVGTCDRAAPCRQISYALTQVTYNGWHGGTVVALDSGGYDPFTIKKSVSVVAAPGVYAEIVVSNAIGIYIDASSNATVVLRGLSLKGDNNLAVGIKVDYVGVMHIEHCIVSGFYQGIRSLVSNAQVLISDTTVKECVEVGIFINSESAHTLTIASIDHCRVLANMGPAIPGGVFYGIGIYARKNVKVTARDTVVTGNSGHGMMAGFEGGSPALLLVENCAVTHNRGHGIFASAGAKIYVSNSTIAFNPNGYGFAESGSGTIYSRRNNTVEENGLGAGSPLVFSSW
jgi:hypothetical protein